MNNYRCLMLLFSLGIVACSSQPTVYLYGKYLDESQKTQIQLQLQANEYLVEINDFDFPTSITRSTILYSLFLKDPESITQVERVAEKAGIKIERTQSLTEGNHWYTKNSLALFLLPENPAGLVPVFQKDLAQTFLSEECDTALSLTLFQNGSYVFSAQNTTSLEADLLEGTWAYRQYPYIELKRQGGQFSDFYFEISRTIEADRVSEIEFIKLSSLSLQHFPKGCVFVYGQRL